MHAFLDDGFFVLETEVQFSVPVDPVLLGVGSQGPGARPPAATSISTSLNDGPPPHPSHPGIHLCPSLEDRLLSKLAHERGVALKPSEFCSSVLLIFFIKKKLILFSLIKDQGEGVPGGSVPTPHCCESEQSTIFIFDIVQMKYKVEY